MDSRYITSAAKAEQLPELHQPEIAFIGRSNSGKSTLLNALLQRKSLARSGSTPGQTRMINFFALDNRLILADLPGYGYQKAQKNVVKHWQPLVTAYLRRPQIRHIVFLIDVRRKLNEEDQELLYLVSRQLPVQLVLTKSDKLNRAECRKARQKMLDLCQHLDIQIESASVVSCLKKQGVAELRQRLFQSDAQER